MSIIIESLKYDNNFFLALELNTINILIRLFNDNSSSLHHTHENSGKLDKSMIN